MNEIRGHHFVREITISSLVVSLQFKGESSKYTLLFRLTLFSIFKALKLYVRNVSHTCTSFCAFVANAECKRDRHRETKKGDLGQCCTNDDEHQR